MILKQCMTRRFLILLIFLGSVGVIFYKSIILNKSYESDSPLIGQSVPAFQLPNVFVNGLPLTHQIFKGQVSLLNIWATWCDACQFEHTTLVQISRQFSIPIYGINYKDNPEIIRQFLHERGNPYKLVATDQSGDVILDFGISGVPVTFLINAEGKIVDRFVGMIDPTMWVNTIYPEILKWQKYADG